MSANPILRFFRREPCSPSPFSAPVLCLLGPPLRRLPGLHRPAGAVPAVLLMAVVAGLQECGVFLVLAQRLLTGELPVRRITLILVMLPFFCSMLVTNDVASSPLSPLPSWYWRWWDVVSC